MQSRAMPTNGIFDKLHQYWTMTKSLQTGLLLVTGLAGYLSGRCPIHGWDTLLAVAASLYLAISGSTVLNMVYDRDIDAKMRRTCWRPLPSGQITVREAMLLGLVMAGVGAGWAVALKPAYGFVVIAGLVFDVLIYTMWLKRRTPWSIVVGGVAGGMPVLAGRVFATDQIDLIGLLLALAILLWIPTHMLTFGMKYAEDYRAAGIPVVPNAYGVWVTRLAIAISTGAAIAAMLLAAWQIGLPWRYLHIANGMGVVLLGFAVASVVRRSPGMNLALYKLASLYMLGSMLLIMVGVVSP